MAEQKDTTSHLENLQGNQISTAPDGGDDYVDAETQKETDWILNGSEEARKVEKQYMRRLNYLILPTISALYFFEYLDRGNVAVSNGFSPALLSAAVLIPPQNAKLLGLDQGHKTKYGGVGPGTRELDAGQWEVVIMIFYVRLHFLYPFHPLSY